MWSMHVEHHWTISSFQAGSCNAGMAKTLNGTLIDTHLAWVRMKSLPVNFKCLESETNQAPELQNLRSELPSGKQRRSSDAWEDKSQWKSKSHMQTGKNGGEKMKKNEKHKMSELGLNYQGILSFTLYLLRPKSCNHWACKETSGKIMNHGKLQKGRDKSCGRNFLQPFVGICPVSWHSALYWRKGVLPAWQSLCGPRDCGIFKVYMRYSTVHAKLNC